MGASDWAFGRDTPIAQLALRGSSKAAVESWFSDDGLRFTSAESDAYGLPSLPSPMGSDPIVLHLARAALVKSPERVLDALARLAERAPIVAILDAEMVDVLPPFLDVEPAEYVAWPCGKEAFMSALQQMGSPLLRERAEADINPAALRSEVERIAKALAALVEGSATDETVRTDLGAAESARAIRGIIRRRRARTQFFPADLFADPAWDILLDLAAARLEDAPVSISSLCIAAAVPTTTALRWIKAMTGAGILEREADPEDGRRSFVCLSDSAVAAMRSYLTLVEDAVI